jgi:hypothetical protein
MAMSAFDHIYNSLIAISLLGHEGQEKELITKVGGQSFIRTKRTIKAFTGENSRLVKITKYNYVKLLVLLSKAGTIFFLSKLLSIFE